MNEQLNNDIGKVAGIYRNVQLDDWAIEVEQQSYSLNQENTSGAQIQMRTHLIHPTEIKGIKNIPNSDLYTALEAIDNSIDLTFKDEISVSLAGLYVVMRGPNRKRVEARLQTEGLLTEERKKLIELLPWLPGKKPESTNKRGKQKIAIANLKTEIPNQTIVEMYRGIVPKNLTLDPLKIKTIDL